MRKKRYFGDFRGNTIELDPVLEEEKTKPRVSIQFKDYKKMLDKEEQKKNKGGKSFKELLDEDWEKKMKDGVLHINGKTNSLSHNLEKYTRIMKK